MLNPSRRRLAGLAAAMLGLTALGGCAGLRLGMQKPEVTVANIRLLDGNLFEQRFVLTLRITNPNRVEIPIEGLSFDLDLNEQPFAKGVSNRALVVPRLGEATTLSALASQLILPKPGLNALLNIVEGMGLYGVNVAHSGSVVGLLLDRHQHDVEKVSKAVSASDTEGVWPRHHLLKVTSGGVV